MVQLPAAGNGAAPGFAGSPRNSRSNCLTCSLARCSALSFRTLPIICSNSASLMGKAAFAGLSCWRPATDRD